MTTSVLLILIVVFILHFSSPYIKKKFVRVNIFHKYRVRDRFKREIGKSYYTICGPLIKLEVRKCIDAGTRFDIRNHQMGIYFETETDAQQRIQEIENFNKG